MSKIRRNAPCPCGSGQKYKRCCGRNAGGADNNEVPTQQDIARFQLELARRNAREHQRRLMQGLGKPIISAEMQEFRLVAVGNQIRWSKAWRTFPDFLFDFIKSAMGVEWGNAELKKIEVDQHPLIVWYRKLCAFQRHHYATAVNGIYHAKMTGAAKAYVGLAYDLYLSAHNAELPELLLKRLRNQQTFEGALYEAYVIGNLAKAGFKIEFEDEGDSTRSHCELTATHQETGRKFSVEVKTVASTSKRAGSSAEPPRIRGKLYEALSKHADCERMIFVDLNRVEVGTPDDPPKWIKNIDDELAQAERDLTIEGQPAPAAYVFVTNRGFLHALDSYEWSEVGLACGFKIDDFAARSGAPSILSLVQARKKHRELHWLRKALERHSAIPSTFDDRLPEEEFRDGDEARLQIGSTYLIPNEDGQEVPGVLVDAIVVEREKLAYGTYKLSKGEQILCTTPLTEAELATYRRSPDTFFGIFKKVSKGFGEPLDCFDFLWNVYSKSTYEKLLEFISAWPDFEKLKALNRDQLAEVYCARIAEPIWVRSQRRSPRGDGA